MTYAILRVRGKINIKPKIKKTLELLNLTRVNHLVVVEENKTTKGMLQTVKDYVTWGKIDKKTLGNLIEKRGRLSGDKEITDKYVKSATTFENIDKLSEAIVDNKFKYKELPNVKPIFRLNPPKKGFEGIKQTFNKNGALGYRGKEINSLIKRML